MPTYAEVLEVYARSDVGLLFLMACVAYALFTITYLMQRHPRFAAQARGLSPLMVPAAVVVVNPLAAGALLAVIALPPLRRWLRSMIERISAPLPLILFGALLLRLPLMGQSLWYDEAFSLRMAQLPLDIWPGAVINDVHPPLFYFAVWGWHALTGDSAILLRALPLVFGILHIYLIYRLSLSLHIPKAAALTAAVIAAVLPAHVYYSTELRNYTMLACVYTAGAIAVMERRRWLLILCMGLAPALHNFGLLYAGMLGAGYLMMHGRAGLKPALLGAVLSAPWAALALAQSGIIADGYFPYISIGALFWPLVQMTVISVDDSYLLATLIPMLALIFASVWARRGWLVNNLRGRVLAVLIIGAPVTAGLVSFLWHPVYVSRTFFPAVMLLPILFGAFLYSRPAWRVMVAGALVVSLLMFYANGSSNTRVNYAGILEDCAPGLPLYATSIPAAFVLAANSDRPLTVWAGSADDAGTFTPDDLPVYRFSVSSAPPDGAFCLLQIDQPLTATAERDYVADLVGDTLPTRHQISRWHVLYVYEVEEHHDR